MNVTQTIPVVDLEALERQDPEAVREAGDALAEVGFFALENHSVTDEVVGRVYHLAQRFFELDAPTKAAYHRAELAGQRGFMPFGREHARDNPAADLKEYFSVGPEPVPADLPPNLWPAEVAELRGAALELYARLGECARAILRACASYAGLPSETFASLIEGGDTLLRILHYPPVPPERDVASVRAAAHEDVNFITLLCGATGEGLQLLSRDGTWQPIHPVPGQIVVDSGDMLQRLTNGVFRSTTHRVVNPDDDRSRRFSLPYFVHPRPSVDLTPLPAFVERCEGERRYPPTTAREYLAARLAELGL